MGRLKGVPKTLRDLTEGLEMREVPDTVRRDASRAYGVLTREHQDRPEPEGLFGRWWHRSRVLFLGLSLKLSPQRRLIFVGCLILVVVGIWEVRVELPGDAVGIVGGSLPMLAAVAGLVLLLALELADRVLVRDELEVARELQRDLLPDRAPDLDGYSFSFSYRTANTIGGDYYDFLPAGEGRLAIVIGDASGHGIAAGLLMAIANAALRTAIDLDPSPSAVIGLLNKALYRSGGPRAFMTVFYGLLEPASGRLEYACAGHPYPLLRRRDGEIVELGSGSLPLGLRPSVEPALGQDLLAPGDLLVLYTDGVPETLDVDGAAFGFDALRREVEAGGIASQVHARITAALDRFAHGSRMMDDRSLVAVDRAARDAS
jgi:serine phosphatase RsbU (regulator of sigma subunit)